MKGKVKFIYIGLLYKKCKLLLILQSSHNYYWYIEHKTILMSYFKCRGNAKVQNMAKVLLVSFIWTINNKYNQIYA